MNLSHIFTLLFIRNVMRNPEFESLDHDHIHVFSTFIPKHPVDPLLPIPTLLGTIVITHSPLFYYAYV